jgi:hypothetical protein
MKYQAFIEAFGPFLAQSLELELLTSLSNGNSVDFDFRFREGVTFEAMKPVFETYFTVGSELHLEKFDIREETGTLSDRGVNLYMFNVSFLKRINTIRMIILCL